MENLHQGCGQRARCVLKAFHPLAKDAKVFAIGWILSKFFVEKAFSEEAKQFGDQIVSDIKAQFVEKLRGAEWMSKNVRDLGIEKGVCPFLERRLSTLAKWSADNL